MLDLSREFDRRKTDIKITQPWYYTKAKKKPFLIIYKRQID